MSGKTQNKDSSRTPPASRTASPRAAGVSRTPPASPRFGGSIPRATTPTTPIHLRTESRAERRYQLASPRIQQVMQDSSVVGNESVEVPAHTRSEGRRNSLEVPSHTLREGRRHFVSPPRNPVMEGATHAEAEWRPSRQMPYFQAREEEPKLDAPWKKIGLFDVKSDKPTQALPREAPHRLSSGFIAAQQGPTARELMKQSPRQHDREQRGLGALAYFSNEPQLPLSDGVKRFNDSRNTGETDMGIFQAEYTEPHSHAPADKELSRPWALDGPNVPLEVRSPEKPTVQTARKNESSGQFVDGLASKAALPLKGRGRNNSPAALAMEHRTPCWATNPLPVKQVAKQITDELPAYNSEDNVRQLIRHYTEAGTTHKETISDRQGVSRAPYGMIDDKPKLRSLSLQRRHSIATSTPLLEIGHVGVSSLMSSGHSAAVSSKLSANSEQVALENDRKHKGVGKVSGRVVLRAVQNKTQDALEEHPKAAARSESAEPYRLGCDASLPRAQSVQYRRLSIGSTGNNHASCVWSGGLRGQISDAPWVSNGEKQIGRVILEPKAIGERSESRGSRRSKSPRLAIRNELSHDQLEDVTASFERGCSERIQSLMNEIGAMSARNDYLRQRMDSFRSESTHGAIADAPVTTTVAVLHAVRNEIESFPEVSSSSFPEVSSSSFPEVSSSSQDPSELGVAFWSGSTQAAIADEPVTIKPVVLHAVRNEIESFPEVSSSSQDPSELGVPAG